jgi:hypothetical protein
VPTWRPTQGQLDAMVRYLRSPSKYLQSVTEDFTEGEYELERKIQAQLLNPARPDSSVAELLFIAVTPRKTIDFYLHATFNEGTRQLEQLSHRDHITVSEQLISTRFLLLVDSIYEIHTPPWDAAATAPLPPLEELGETLDRLMKIPAMSPSEGLQEVNILFDSNAKLRVLEGVSVDFDKMVDLYLLCRILATRWLTIVRIPIDAGSSDRLSFRYAYRRPFDERFPNVIAHLRRWMNGPPSELKIHLPLARSCSNYTASIEAPKGFYFSESLLVSDAPGRPSQPADKRMWGKLRSAKSERNVVRVPEDKYIKTESRPTLSNILLTNGHLEKGRLYLYLRLFETPPGTLIHAASALTLVALVLLWPIYFVVARSDPIPDYSNVLLAIMALIASVVIVLHPGVDIDRPAAMPKVMMIVQFIAVIFFALWLYTEPNRPHPVHRDKSTDVLGFIRDISFGVAIVLLLIICAGYLWYRLSRLVRDHNRVLKEIKRRQQV